MKLPVIPRNNILQSFLDCPQKFKRLHIDKVPSTSDKNLDIGLAVHAGLEHWRGFASLDTCIKHVPEVDPFIAAVARGMLRAYARFYAEDDYKVISAEQEFEVEIGGITMGGRIDAIWEGSDGRLWIVEHKTTGEDVEDYLDKKVFDRQTVIYLAAARKLGYNTRGVLVDALQKPRLPARTPKDLSALEYKFELDTRCMRGAFFKTDREIVNVVKDIQDISQLMSMGLYPRNPGACFNFFRRCQFYGDCSR